MTAKIDWYREVLELEPNSKVFFPLARLVADDGNSEEAMRLLEKGLERHPEYLEARLFRIELLHQAGRKEECNAEIAKLSKMFASYAGFWQAWAACLASEQGQSDTASLIRFLAAHFVSGPLQLHEVLNRGLDAMLMERQGATSQITATEGSPALEEPKAVGEPVADRIEPEPAPASPQPIGMDVEADKPPMEAAEAFMSDSGAMLADLDSELELAGKAQELGNAIMQEAPAHPEIEPAAAGLEAEPETRLFDDALEESEPQAHESTLAADADAELQLTEMDEIPAVVVSQAVGQSMQESPALEPEEEIGAGEADEMAGPADDSAQDETALSGLEEAADTFAAPVAPGPLSDFDLKEPIIIESAPEVIQAGERAAGMDLEADMQAVLAAEDLEPIVNAVETVPAELEIEPEQAVAEVEGELEPAGAAANDLEAAVSESAVDEIEPEFESAAASATSADALADAIEPEIAAQLSAPEADFFAVPLAQPQPKPAPANLAEAEAAMVDGLELPDMDLHAADEQAAGQATEAEAFEEPEEPFSLRTRSMAEVLAEQGDIQGALDIYEELAAAATSGDELEDINRRVATLRGRLTIANASANFNAAEEASAAQNNKKLISMLEALAQRVEARAQ